MNRAVRTVLITLVALVGLATVPTGAAAAAVPKPPRAIVLTVGPSTVGPGQPARLNLSLTPNDGGRPKGGTITWRVGDTVLGTATARSRYTALVLDDLPLGTYEVVADYSGDPETAPATSNTVTLTVAPFRTFTDLTRSAATVPAGNRAEVKADVRAARWPVEVTGSVSFTATSSAGTRMGTVPLNTQAGATWRPLLPAGTWQITARYNGVEDLYAPSDSASIAITVTPV